MIKPMYRGKPFSPQTFLKESIGAGDTQMSVVDPSILPNEPNYLTIWEKSEDKYEVVSYTGINNDIVLGLKRGVEGTPQEFTTDAIVFRTFTNSDYGTLIDNIETLEAEKQPVGEYSTADDVVAKIAEHNESTNVHSRIMDTKVNTDWSNANDFKLTPTNIVMGQGAMSSNDTGVDNIAIGTDALKYETKGQRNIAIGNLSLTNFLGEKVGEMENVAIGYEALEVMKEGRGNVGVGALTLSMFPIGDGNVAIGNYANAMSEVEQNGTIAIGNLAGLYGLETGAIAIGEQAGYLGISKGAIAIGKNAMYDKSATYSIAIGENALVRNERTENIAIGYSALKNSGTGSANVAIGMNALLNNTSGGSNIAIGGRNTQANSTTGSINISIGYQSSNRIKTGYRNIGIGSSSLLSVVEGYDNIAIGHDAMSSLSANAFRGNVAIGGYALSKNSGEYNTVIGHNGLTKFEGSQCTAIGMGALSGNITGTGSTAIGVNALLYNTNGSANTSFMYSVGLGADTRVSANNQVQLGSSGTTTFAFGAVQNRSDIRDKADVQDTKLGLDFIQKLRPVDFRWDYRDDYFKEVHVIELQLDDDGYPEETLVERLMKIPKDGSKKRNRLHHGLIAQEVKETIDTMGVDFGGYQDHSINGGCDVKSIGYEELISPMIKAIQELKSQVDDLTKQIAELKEVNKLL